MFFYKSIRQNLSLKHTELLHFWCQILEIPYKENGGLFSVETTRYRRAFMFISYVGGVLLERITRYISQLTTSRPGTKQIHPSSNSAAAKVARILTTARTTYQSFSFMPSLSIRNTDILQPNSWAWRMSHTVNSLQSAVTKVFRLEAHFPAPANPEPCGEG